MRPNAELLERAKTDPNVAAALQEDIYRRSGRTKRQLLNAIHAMLEGQNVTLVYHTDQCRQLYFRQARAILTTMHIEFVAAGSLCLSAFECNLRFFTAAQFVAEQERRLGERNRQPELFFFDHTVHVEVL